MRSGLPSSLLSRKVDQTTAVLNIYVNSSTGNDANPGTAELPKLTLQAAANLIPTFVKHNCKVHATGVFSEQKLVIERFVETGKFLIVDGGTALTTVADNGGSPWVADIHAAGYIGLTTAGWTPNQYQGWWLEIVSGPCAGQHMTIKSHTADTIYPAHDFTGDPGLAQFRICRPSTEFSSSTGYNYISLRNLGGGGLIILERFYISGSKSYLQIQYSFGSVYVTQSICNSSYATNPINVSFNVGLASFGWYYYDDSFTIVSTAYLGVSKLNNTNAMTLFSTATFSMGYGHINGLKIMASGSGVYTFSNKTVLICVDAGLTVRDGYCNIAGGADFSNCSGHGIEVVRGHLHLDGIVTGSGNGGAGVYAHDGSVVNIKNGSPPTLTGTVGDLSTDGTTPAGTWAGVDGGERIFDLNEGTLIKEAA